MKEGKGTEGRRLGVRTRAEQGWRQNDDTRPRSPSLHLPARRLDAVIRTSGWKANFFEMNTEQTPIATVCVLGDDMIREREGSVRSCALFHMKED